MKMVDTHVYIVLAANLSLDADPIDFIKGAEGNMYNFSFS